MKTYEEIATELFDRRDAYYARRARQRKMALAAGFRPMLCGTGRTARFRPAAEHGNHTGRW